MVRAFEDRWGSQVYGENETAIELFNLAVHQLVSLSGDPVATADQAAALDPQLVLGRVLQAYLALYSTAASGFTAARSLVGSLDPWSLAAGERELLHVLAVQAWADGELEHAADHLERALLHDPHDLLALKVAQDLYFFLGNGNDLRDVVQRALRAWRSHDEGYGYVQGMFAFGFEENYQFGAAQEQVQRALTADPCDVWAIHAQAHIYEMQGAQRQGIAFLVDSADNWSTSYFATHNWWHRALYHLELAEFAEVLDLYDGPIRGSRSTEWLDIVDAASLLWRLHLFGVEVGERAGDLTVDIERILDEPVSVFNDWHAVMAAELSGNRELSEHLISANRGAKGGTNRRSLEEAGFALLEGFVSFARGDATGALHQLLDLRPKAHVVGGSNAQRDVIELTLIASAARADNPSLARSLLEDRVTRKPPAKAAGRELIRINGAMTSSGYVRS